ncbi:PH domain protein [Cooperia oncophora]
MADKPSPPTSVKKKRQAPTMALPKEPKEKKGILRSLSFQRVFSLSQTFFFQFSNLGRRKDNPYDMTPEETTSEELGPIIGVQCYGTLWKKYKKKNRPATWSKRFFLLKECFLIYYSTRFKKTFQKNKRIDLHPKRVFSFSLSQTFFFQFSNLGRRKDNPYDMTPEETTSEELGPIIGVQCYGTLWKKYKKKNRPATWSKRFFLLKECFLIYYSTRFKKTFQKNKRIDLHPKGIIPLIGCSIVCGGDVGKKHCLLIAHPQFPSAIIVAAPDFKTQEEWLKALRNATKISFKNTLVGETMIRELESKGLILCEEKKTYEEKLEQEAKARKEEHERAAVSVIFDIRRLYRVNSRSCMYTVF